MESKLSFSPRHLQVETIWNSASTEPTSQPPTSLIPNWTWGLSMSYKGGAAGIVQWPSQKMNNNSDQAEWTIHRERDSGGLAATDDQNAQAILEFRNMKSRYRYIDFGCTLQRSPRKNCMLWNANAIHFGRIIHTISVFRWVFASPRINKYPNLRYPPNIADKPC